jgi:hypothetical protein
MPNSSTRQLKQQYKGNWNTGDTISRDAITVGNNIYRRGVNQSSEWGANNSKDTKNSSYTKNIITYRNVGNTSSRKDSNSSRAGSNIRYLSQIRDS